MDQNKKNGLVSVDLSGVRYVFKRIKLNKNNLIINLDKDTLINLFKILGKEEKRDE